MPVHLTPPLPALFYSRAIARLGRKQWRLAWACVTTASCTTVITPSPPPSLRLSWTEEAAWTLAPAAFHGEGKLRPRESMAGTQAVVRRGDSGRPVGCSSSWLPLCAVTQRSANSMQKARQYVVQASQAAQPLSQLSSALQPKGGARRCVSKWVRLGARDPSLWPQSSLSAILSRSGPWP